MGVPVAPTNPMAVQQLGAQGQGPMGFPTGSPGFTPQPPAALNPLETIDVAPIGDVYEIDPLVLSAPVKIRIDGSSRMLSRAALQQIWPFLAQATMNGPFLQALGAQGMTVDMIEMARMVQEATGTSRQFRIFRPLNQQEQQARQQPSPELQAKLQLGQQEQQTRTQIMQMKTQSEQAMQQVEMAMKSHQIDEESARHILALLQKEQGERASKPDPRQEMVMEAQKHQMDMRAKQAELAQKAQEHQMDMRMKMATQHMDLAGKQAEMQHQAMSRQADLQHQMATQQQDWQFQHETGNIKARNMLAQGRAKAQAAKMMPQKPTASSKK